MEVCGGNNIIVDSSNCGHPRYSEFMSVVARVPKSGGCDEKFQFLPLWPAVCILGATTYAFSLYAVNGVNNKERH